MSNYKGPPAIDPRLVVGEVHDVTGTAVIPPYAVGRNFDFSPYLEREPEWHEVPDIGYQLEVPSERQTQLPVDHRERKEAPLCTGVLDYFAAALVEVSKCSRQGNVQHKLSGANLRWDQEKSTDHADCLVRHLAERGTFDTDGIRHSAKAAWRSLALLQIELQAEGAPKPRAAT